MPFLPMFKKRKLSPIEHDLSENVETFNTNFPRPSTSSTISIDFSKIGKLQEQEHVPHSISTVSINFAENGDLVSKTI